MLKVSTSTKWPDATVQEEVDSAVALFDSWYKGHCNCRMIPAEVAIIKTFLGYFLGVGGHYKDPNNE